MNRKTKHFLIALALAVRLILTSALVVSCYDNVAFRYETKYIEYKINQTICVENERIRCTYPSYHKGSNKIEMYFEIHDETHGQEKDFMKKLLHRLTAVPLLFQRRLIHNKKRRTSKKRSPLSLFSA